MKRLYLIFALVIAAVVLAVGVLELGDPDVQTEAALPGAQDGSGLAVAPPPCMGLEGAALRECRIRAGGPVEQSPPVREAPTAAIR